MVELPICRLIVPAMTPGRTVGARTGATVPQAATRAMKAAIAETEATTASVVWMRNRQLHCTCGLDHCGQLQMALLTFGPSLILTRAA
jgi:hypothetical protein